MLLSEGNNKMQKKQVITNLLLLGILLFNLIPVKAQTSLSDETRFPWATSQKEFFRDWLIIGGFPNPDGKGFDTDYFQATEAKRIFLLKRE